MTSGPNILKKVFTPNSRRTGATFFIAGWKRGACRIQIPALSTQRFKKFGSFENLTPKASKTLLDPQPRDFCLLFGLDVSFLGITLIFYGR